MKIKGLTEQELRNVVWQVSQEHYNGNITFRREPELVGRFLHFTLTVKDSRDLGGRRSNSGRRVAAVCWHGFRDIMQAIFEGTPRALLVTAMARYDGASDFEDKYVATGRQNMGSQFAPMEYENACDCHARGLE